MTRFPLLTSAAILLTLAATHEMAAQEGDTHAVDAVPAAQTNQPALRVFLDCGRCDQQFLRTEITFVDFVRDRQDADVHILVTQQPAGVGGTRYSLGFIGLGTFQGVSDELAYTTTLNDTPDSTRRGLSQVLTGGLVRYAVRTPMAQTMQLSFGATPARGRPGAPDTSGPQALRDPWNAWVFRTSLGGSVTREASYRTNMYNVSGSANRTTAALKTNLAASSRLSQSETRLNSGTWISNDQREHSLNALAVRSISDHWSIGARSNANHSTFQNRDLQIRLAPAVEYSLFPYAESTRRQMTLQYTVGANQVKYLQETIFGRTEEALADQALELSFNTNQPWGSADASVEGSHYLHDSSKYRVSANAGANLRLFRGFTLNLNGSGQRIHDQLHLVKGNLTDEQILLRQRQVATAYRYNFTVGVGYSFGSIYSGVVNPRMSESGGGGGQGMRGR
jgi:hypothetical protein